MKDWVDESDRPPKVKESVFIATDCAEQSSKATVESIIIGTRGVEYGCILVGKVDLLKLVSEVQIPRKEIAILKNRK